MIAPASGPPPARVMHVSCTYGGTGVSAPGHVTAVIYFEAAASVALGSLRVVDLEISDVAGETLARALPPIELRVSLPGRDEHHNLRTEAFGGGVAAGTTLRLCASAALIFPAGRAPPTLRYRASIHIVLADGERGAPLVLEGPLDQPWATAGPARPIPP